MPWTNWCHNHPALVHFPRGTTHYIDGGADQSDPLVNVYCVLVPAGVVEEACGCTYSIDSGASLPRFYVWFADDGQMLRKPGSVDSMLCALDAEAAFVSASRMPVDVGDVRSFVELPGAAGLLRR